MQLGKLEKVNLRDVWKHEALDFTNWLAETENLSLLGNEINVEISLIQTEASVGKFSVDILAEEEQTGRKIIIENQLEITDHDHLGKIITYASGLDAEIIVWIVREVRDEHKQAVDWLNEHTDEKLNFFIIKMEIWKIGDSPYAPKFHIISQPNDWAKAIKRTALQDSKPTELKLLQLDFWESFANYFSECKSSNLKFGKPSRPQHYCKIGSINSQSGIFLTTDSRLNQIACELYIPNSKELFYSLENSKEKIEQELGYKLIWMDKLPKSDVASRIKAVGNGNIKDTENWNLYFAWFVEKAESFVKVISKYASVDS